jgi:phosphohistidine phosphatase
MLRLLLLRHAEAAVYATGGDLLRPLTASGRADAARIGEFLRKAGLAPDRVLFSPAFRTRETLDIVERQIPKPFARWSEPSLYNASVSALDSVVAKTPTGVRTLLIVAHNPALGEFASARVHDGEADSLAAIRRHFPAPCLAVIDFACDDWSETPASTGWLDRFVTVGTLS